VRLSVVSGLVLRGAEAVKVAGTESMDGAVMAGGEAAAAECGAADAVVAVRIVGRVAVPLRALEASGVVPREPGFIARTESPLRNTWDDDT
jgi:hypothetical protein